MKQILIVNGPNLNMAGKREPEIYGNVTLEELNKKLYEYATEKGVKVEFFQSNHEGAIVDIIQSSMKEKNVIIINPAAYTHTSIAIRDALLAVQLPIVEVHLSNIYKREDFRHKSFVSDIANGTISGFGYHGYFLAIDASIRIINQN